MTACQQDMGQEIPNNLKAIAGEDQEVTVETIVFLEGKVEGATGVINYLWTIKSKPDGSQVEIDESQKPNAQFRPDLVGEYILELTVKQHTFSAKDELKITAIAENEVPIQEPENYLSKDINEDTVWENKFEDPAIPDYIVTKEITVNAKLTILPGVVVHFKEDAGLKINGNIVAIGLPDQRISLQGEQPNSGYWKGVLLNTTSTGNKLNNVLIAHAGGKEFNELPGVRANLLLKGFSQPTYLELKNLTIRESNSYGLYVSSDAQLSVFENNSFSNNTGPSAFVPASQIHKLDFHSRFKGQNGFDGVETGGDLFLSNAVHWNGFNDQSKYLISSDLIVKSGLEIKPGSLIEMLQDKMIHVLQNGYLKAIGSQSQRIDISANIKDGIHNWKGIWIQSSHPENILSRADVSYAGSALIPGMSHKANIVVSGKLILRMSRINHSAGYGIYAKESQAVNEDIATSNVFGNNTLGNVFPVSLANPGQTTLQGDWMDWWSFNEELFNLDPEFYNVSSGMWFGGAATPWHTNRAGGFGIRFSEDGKFTWLITEKFENDPNCLSYSTEYIIGNYQEIGQSINFQQTFWRSKFYLSCDTSQNYEEQVETGTIRLPYEIKRSFHPLSGLAFWELKFTNPDNSTFSYFKL